MPIGPTPQAWKRSVGPWNKLKFFQRCLSSLSAVPVATKRVQNISGLSQGAIGDAAAAGACDQPMARVVGRQRPLWLGLSEERKLAKFLMRCAQDRRPCFTTMLTR